MPQKIERLVELLRLDQTDAGHFQGQHDRTPRQRTFGGLVLAQALVAASQSVEETRRPHSLHAYFLRPGRADMPIDYEVEETRDGRSFSQRRIAAKQDGRHIFQMATSFQVPEDGLDHADPMPEVPDPDDCPRMSEVLARATGHDPASFEQEWGVLDVRYVGDSRGAGERRIEPHAHTAHARVWVRVDGDLPGDRIIHEAALAYASDLTLLSIAVQPHRVRWHPSEVQAASLDHSMWFHRPVRADRWWLFDQTTPTASGARGLSLGRIFQDGVLVTTAAQEGMLRVDPAILARLREQG